MQNSEQAHRIEFKKAKYSNGYSLSNFADTEIAAMRCSLRASWLDLYAVLEILDLAPLNFRISAVSKGQAILAETRILRPLGYMRAVKRLQNAGVEEKQAEEMVGIFGELFDNQVATKQDLDSVHKELKQEIGSVRQELKQEIESVHQDLKSQINEVKTDVAWIKKFMFGVCFAVIYLSGFNMQNSEQSHRIEFKKAKCSNGDSLANFADTEIGAMRRSLKGEFACSSSFVENVRYRIARPSHSRLA